MQTEKKSNEEISNETKVEAFKELVFEDNKSREANSEEENSSGEDVREKTIAEVIDTVINNLRKVYSKSSFEYTILEDDYHDIIEIIADEIIAFRQIITSETTSEMVENSFERNLRAYEKLSKTYMEKHGQEIRYMDQAEVTSIKTVKEIEKPEEN